MESIRHPLKEWIFGLPIVRFRSKMARAWRRCFLWEPICLLVLEIMITNKFKNRAHAKWMNSGDLQESMKAEV